MTERLIQAGLDPKNLPPLERLDRGAILQVMNTFNESLGVPCTGCHDEGDVRADTHRKRVARRMWNEFVRVLAFDKTAGDTGDKGPVYCDSCHQGRLFSLDRRDKAKVADFMSSGFVDGLKRVDNREHDCGTCHGDPPEFQFLDAWKSSPAPDLILADELAPPPPPSRAAHPTPKPTPVATQVAVVRKPPPPIARPVAAGECGDKNHPCPMQKWMRANVATAVAAGDTAALARALDRVATMSPNPGWQWVQISTTAAAAARNGDMAEARKSCTGCHNLYKEPWKASYRKRAVN